MSDNDNHKEQRIGLWIAGGAAVLAVVPVLFYAVWGWENGKIEGSPGYAGAASEVLTAAAAASETAASGVQTASEPETAAVAAETAAQASAAAAEEASAAEQILAVPEPVTAASEGASAVVENGVVKFYFATGKADLADNAQEALKDVLEGVKAGKKAVISGFHDVSGNKTKNEILSKQRAFAVRDALLAFGVPEAQIELRKPDNADAGNGAQARRVEVLLAD